MANFLDILKQKAQQAVAPIQQGLSNIAAQARALPEYTRQTPLARSIQGVANTPIPYNPNSVTGRAINTLVPATNAIARPMTQVSRGLTASSTYGILDLPQTPKATSLGDKLAYGAGFGLGVVNPLNPLNKINLAAGLLGSRGTGALISKIAPKATGFLAEKALPALGAELAQTGLLSGGQYVGNKVGLNETKDALSPLNIASNVGLGLGFRGLGGLSGAKSNFHLDPKTFDELYQAGEVLTNPKAYADSLGHFPAPGQKEEAVAKATKQALETVDRLAAKYLPDKVLNKVAGDPIKTIKALEDLHFQNKLANVPGMGFVGVGEGKTGMNDVPKELNSIAKEAKKYKSAQEFIDSIKQPEIPDNVGAAILEKAIKEPAVAPAKTVTIGGKDYVLSQTRNSLGQTTAIVSDNGKPVSFLQLSKGNTVNRIFTEPSYRNKGIAKYLYNELNPISSDVFSRSGAEAATRSRGFSSLEDFYNKSNASQSLGNEPQKLNVNKLNLPEDLKAQVRSVETPEPRTVLPNKAVQEAAVFAEGRKAPVNEAQTTQKLAEQLVSRQKVVSLENEFAQLKTQGAAPEVLQSKIEEIAKQSKIARTEGTEAGRQLQARNILADPQATPMQKVFRLLDNAGVDAQKYTKEAVNVNWGNAESVVNFYRKFVPPKASEWLDTIRYNSMLSSPNTHINNAFSNLLNTAVVAPVEKAVTGGVDFLGSKITGKPRQYYAGEAGAYAKGYIESARQAAQVFRDTIGGKNAIKNLDLNYMPLGTEGKTGKLLKNYSLPTRALEAVDQFFTTLTAGGERAGINYKMAKGVKVANPEELAQRAAVYRLFRGDLKPEQQGHVLNAIDEVTGLIQRARSSDNPIVSFVAKFTLPFVKTPMNILKQGLEYSPAGLVTTIGAKNKTEQVAKAMMGTAGMAATAMLVKSGRTTWEEPTDPTKKQAFRDAGLQPYSIKLGDHWYSITKLPPAIGFPIAFVAALHDAEENKTIDQNQLDTILSGVAKSGKFFADQSYVKNIGDLLNLTKGDPEKIAAFFSNYPQQLVPWRAFLGWTARLLDPYQRKVDTGAGYVEQQLQQLEMQIPGLSQNVPTRNNQFGEPIPNQNRVQNAFSPIKVTNEMPAQKEYYDQLKQKTLMTRNLNAAKSLIEQGKEVPPGIFDVGASGALPQQADLRAQMQEDILRQKIKFGKSSGATINGKYLYPEGGSVKSVTLPTPIDPPALTGNETLDKELVSKYTSKLTTQKNNILKLYQLGQMTQEETIRQLDEIQAQKDAVTPKKEKVVTPKKSVGKAGGKKALNAVLSATKADLNKRAQLRKSLTALSPRKSGSAKSILAISATRPKKSANRKLEDLLKTRSRRTFALPRS